MSLQSNENNLDDIFSFSGSVGRSGDNDRADVIKAQALLANAGYYDLPKPGVPTGWAGGELASAIQTFQKDNGLEADGILLPVPAEGVSVSGEGETVKALQEKLGEHLQGYAAPTPQQVDRFYDRWMIARGDDDQSSSTTPIVTGQDHTASGRPQGVVPLVMSDIDVSDAATFAPGQEEARGPMLRPAPPPVRMQPPTAPRAPLAPIPPPLPPQASPPDEARPTDRIPENWLSERSLLKRLQEPNPYAPQPAEQPQRGRIVIAEDGKELRVPPLGAWADKLAPDERQVANAINDALAEEMALHIGGSRGNQVTQEGINAGLKACLDALREVLPEAAIKHIAGGNQKGNADNEALKEEHLWEFDENGNPVRKGSNRSDWTIVIARTVATAVRGNTYDADGGKMTDREANAEAGIRNKTEGDYMVTVEKEGPERSKADIRQDAYKACYDVAMQIRADWSRKGEFERPAPADPAEYKGPENARRAEAIRRMRGKQ